jgi:hypothetical protein
LHHSQESSRNPRFRLFCGRVGQPARLERAGGLPLVARNPTGPARACRPIAARYDEHCMKSGPSRGPATEQDATVP